MVLPRHCRRAGGRRVGIGSVSSSPSGGETWSNECVRYALAVFQIELVSQFGADVDSAYTRTVPVMATIYLFGMLYFLMLVWDALRMRNTIQVIGLCLGNLCLMVFGAAEPKQVQDAIEKIKFPTDFWGRIIPVEIAIPCILLGGTIIMSFIAWKLYNEFAWSIYKHISADLRMKQRYMTYQVCYRHPAWEPTDGL